MRARDAAPTCCSATRSSSSPKSRPRSTARGARWRAALHRPASPDQLSQLRGSALAVRRGCDLREEEPHAGLKLNERGIHACQDARPRASGTGGRPPDWVRLTARCRGWPCCRSSGEEGAERDVEPRPISVAALRDRNAAGSRLSSRRSAPCRRSSRGRAHGLPARRGRRPSRRAGARRRRPRS